MKRIATFNNPINAHLARDALAAVDIRAFLSNEHLGFATGGIGLMGGIGLDVIDDDEHAALAALADWRTAMAAPIADHEFARKGNCDSDEALDLGDLAPI